MYAIETDVDGVADVHGLPHGALVHYAEVLALLEVAPWSGEAYKRRRPDGAMRVAPFGSDGEGFVVYVVLEDQRRVVVLRVVWLAA